MLIDYLHSNRYIDYGYALDFMENRVKCIIENSANQAIWLLEHPEIYTVGSNAPAEDLIEHSKFPVYHSNRGGKYTYHGPGQRVIYLMLNLKSLYGDSPDIRHFIKMLEKWIIAVLARFGIFGEIKNGRVGIWVATNCGEKKLAAIGIRVKKWVTYHGIAINVFSELENFNGIIPCGIKEYGVTSMYDLDQKISLELFDQVLIEEFYKNFNYRLDNKIEIM